MERRSWPRTTDGQPGPNEDRVSSTPEPRSSPGGNRSALARSIAQHRAFIDLARAVASGQQGIWTAALPILLAPAGAVWGGVYRVTGSALELSASEGLPLALRAHVEAFDLARHPSFAACRATRTRRAVIEEKIFSAVVPPRVAPGLEGAGISYGVAVPIVHGGTVFGVLVAGAPTRDAIDADSLTFLGAAASLLAPAFALADSGRARPDDRSSADPPRAQARPHDAPASPLPPRGSPLPPRGSPLPPRRSSIPPSDVPQPSTADVGRTAVEAVQQCTPFLRRTGIDMRLAVQEGYVAVGEASDLGLAIAHLVMNAAEAAAERAPSALAPSQPRRVRVTVTREGTMILVSVDDSGRGVPPDLRARVFEPGFSTKGKTRGSGLTMVWKIATGVGGHVEVGASDLGGASFRLVLPASMTRPEPSVSGQWDTGATWPQMHASGRETREAGERGGGDGEADGGPRAALGWRLSSK
jgi:hypothetical protein